VATNRSQVRRPCLWGRLVRPGKQHGDGAMGGGHGATGGRAPYAEPRRGLQVRALALAQRRE